MILSVLKSDAPVFASCACSPAGDRVVCGWTDHTLRVFSIEGGTKVATLAGDSDVVSACALSADGQRIVSAS